MIPDKSKSIKQQQVKGAIKLFAEIFSSTHLNIKNKQQLVKHLIMHTNPIVIQSTSSKKQQQQIIPNENKLNKVTTIALTVLSIASITSKRQETLDADLFTQLKLILKNCETYPDNTLLRIQAEATVNLNLSSVLKDPLTQVDLLLKDQEVTFQQLVQHTAEDEWFKKCKVIAVIGNLLRLADFESLLKPFSQRILDLFNKFSKENNVTVRENFLHYSSVALKRCSQDMPMFFQSLFTIGFHQMQTDIKTGYVALNSLGKMVET